MTTAKLALSVSLEQLKSRPMEQWDTFLQDRAICDDVNNPDPSIVQIITYGLFIVNDAVASSDPATTMFVTYDRPDTGDESRLHGKASIGFGGHIGREVQTDLFTLIVEEYIREVQEELGYVLPYRDASAAIMGAVRQNRFIFTPNDAAGSIHIGIVPVIAVSQEQYATFVPNPKEVLNLRLTSLESLSNMPKEDEVDQNEGPRLDQLINAELLDAFETWSATILKADVIGMHKERTNRMLQEAMQKQQEQFQQEQIAAMQAAQSQALLEAQQQGQTTATNDVLDVVAEPVDDTPVEEGTENCPAAGATASGNEPLEGQLDTLSSGPDHHPV